MADTLVIIGFAFGAVLVLGGIWAEAHASNRRAASAQPGAIIRPIAPPAAPSPAREPQPPHAPPTSTVPGNRLVRIPALLRAHPAPLLGWLETAFWLLILASVADHISDIRHSTTGIIVYYIVIGPHEIGHILCMPFGFVLHVAGGTIWQALWFALPAIYLFFVYRRISGSLLFWAVVGHSFINMTPYIQDARARDLPLLFGMDKSHHDWWNLLGHFDLLEYDQTIGWLATGIGITTLVIVAALGILTTWALPRRRLGPVIRFTGSFWAALSAALYDGPQVLAAEPDPPTLPH